MAKILFLMILFLAMPSQAEEPNWSDYEGLLSDYISSGEKHEIQLDLVDYQAWGRDSRWPDVLKSIDAFDVSTLQGKHEQIAFWINVYNILAIKVVLDHQPIDSIRDIGSFFSPVWKKDAGMVARKIRSLHEVEHQILRPMGEPRIHFAIVCASVSCPDLLPYAYRGRTLNAQLHEQAINFVSNQGKGVLRQDDGLLVSHIFDWFADDFKAVGGVQAWLLTLPQPATGKIAGYLDYDWSLNDK